MLAAKACDVAKCMWLRHAISQNACGKGMRHCKMHAAKACDIAKRMRQRHAAKACGKGMRFHKTLAAKAFDFAKRMRQEFESILRGQDSLGIYIYICIKVSSIHSL
jgi:hypothetical protein